jgi:phosphoglycerol transferase MdoB-like AlkP superfamily enzyme
MVLGMSLAAYTTVHVIITLIGIASGFIVLFGLLSGRLLGAWNGVFLVTTVLTSVTGLGFPYTKVTPGIILGLLSLVILAIAIFALYGRHLRGGWRRTYVITAMIALYFNVFVLVAQLFEHVPAIHALAPTQSEGPFKIAQLLLLILFVVFITGAARKFRPVLAEQSQG